MKILLAILCTLVAAQAVPPLPTGGTTGPSFVAIDMGPYIPTLLTFSCGITVNMKTGKVTLPEGMKLDRASAEFWGAVGQMFSKQSGPWTLLETLTEAKRENAALVSFMSGTQGEDFLAKEGKMLDLYIQHARGVKP